jgi:hypothetical protein
VNVPIDPEQIPLRLKKEAAALASALHRETDEVDRALRGTPATRAALSQIQARIQAALKNEARQLDFDWSGIEVRVTPRNALGRDLEVDLCVAPGLSDAEVRRALDIIEAVCALYDNLRQEDAVKIERKVYIISMEMKIDQRYPVGFEGRVPVQGYIFELSAEHDEEHFKIFLTPEEAKALCPSEGWMEKPITLTLDSGE